MKEEPLIVYGGPDDRLFAAFRERLEPRGYELEWVKDPWRLPVARSGDYCWLLILDVDLTAAKDFDLLRRIKAAHPAIPVIVVTERTSLANVGLARIDGTEALFFKPLTSFEPVLEIVERALDRLRRWEDVLVEYAQRA